MFVLLLLLFVFVLFRFFVKINKFVVALVCRFVCCSSCRFRFVGIVRFFVFAFVVVLGGLVLH